jgi:hypothetical protein
VTAYGGILIARNEWASKNRRGTHSSQCVGAVDAPSRAAVHRILEAAGYRTTLNDLKNHWSDTGSAATLAALAKVPSGTLILAPLDPGGTVLGQDGWCTLDGTTLGPTRGVEAPEKPPSSGLINDWDVMKAIGAKPVIHGAGRGPGNWMRRTTNKDTGGSSIATWNSWDDVAKAFPSVKEWATPVTRWGGGSWFDAACIPAERLKWDDGKPVKFAIGRPCEEMTNPDQWSFTICARPATAEGRSGNLGSKRDEVVPLCGIHAGAAKRRAATNERYRHESEARQEKRDREKAMTKASAEWAARLRDEFGIHAEGAECDERLQVLVEPEHLYGLLVEAAGIFRDFEIPDPPFGGS